MDGKSVSDWNSVSSSLLLFRLSVSPSFHVLLPSLLVHSLFLRIHFLLPSVVSKYEKRKERVNENMM